MIIFQAIQRVHKTSVPLKVTVTRAEIDFITPSRSNVPNPLPQVLVMASTPLESALLHHLKARAIG